jgi:short-subunit dehydrogenase
MTDTKKYTLITGGSQGIGKAMATACAKRGMNLLIVALDNEHLLNSVAAFKATYPNISIDSLGIDLSGRMRPRKYLIGAFQRATRSIC